MIAFLTICYVGLIWLVFFKLKLLAWNKPTQALAVTFGLVAAFLLIVLMGLYQPQSVTATVSQKVVPIVVRVQGRVLEVPVEANVPISKGDVLMRIDPAPYQAVVEGLEAALAEAEQAVPQLKAAWEEATAAREQTVAERDLARIERDRIHKAYERQAASELERDTTNARYDVAEAALRRAEASERRARLAYESEIGGVNTTVAQTLARLERARIDLRECTVYAPADGRVTQLFVEPGAVTSTVALSSVMSFVYAGDVVIRAHFPDNSLRHMKRDDMAEVVFDTVPGEVFKARVTDIAAATGSGALTPGGTLLTTSEMAGDDLVLVRIVLDDERLKQDVPIGTGCTVGVYTSSGKPIRIIRKVVLRIQAWFNYL